MGVSFKVGRVGTRYRPRPVQDEGQENENDVAPVAETQSRKRLSTGNFSGKVHKVDDHANKEGNMKSGMHLVLEDMKVSFSVNLFPNGFSVGKANEHFNGLPNLLCPYSRASDGLFSAIEYGCLPGDFFGDISCTYNNGAVLSEIKDYRHCMYEKAGITSIVNSPVIHKVLLQMCMENVVKDILSVLDGSWTYKDLLEVESCLLKVLQPDLHLNPEPLLDKFCGAPMRKKLDLRINWGWKKRRLNDAPATNPKFNGQQQRSVLHSQATITSSIANLQYNNGLLESIVQPNALKGVPNYQSVNSCSQSVLEDLTSPSLSSVPTLCFSKRNSVSRVPSSSVLSQQDKCNPLAIQRPIIKVKQEIVDFSEQKQLLPWNQPSPLAMVPNYQLVDSCNQSVVGDLTSSSLSSDPPQCYSTCNRESREPSSLVRSLQGGCDELHDIQRPITKMLKQEPTDFSQQLPPWSQPSPSAMLPNYQLVGSCSQSVVGDLTSSSLPSVPIQWFSNSDFKEPSSFGLSQLGSYPGSQPNPLAMVPNYQLGNSCSQSVVGDLTSSNLLSISSQCCSNSQSGDPSSLVCSPIGRCEMQAFQRPRFNIPKQENMDFSQQLPPVNLPNPLVIVPNYQLVDGCNQSVLGDLTSSNLSNFPMQYFSKRNSESRGTSSLVHSHLGRPEMQAAIEIPTLKTPKLETMDYQQPYPSAMVPNYQLAGSHSQSVVGDLTSSSVSFVPVQGFSKRNRGSREPGSLVQSQLVRGEPQAIQRPILPKQEPIDFSQQQLPGSKPEFIFAAGMQQNAMSYQRPGAKKVPGERFNEKRGQSLLTNSGQPAILEGIPKLHSGMSTSTVRQPPAETRNFFPTLDVTRIKDRCIDMDMRSNQSNLQQVQMQGSSQMLGNYAPSHNSPWNQLPNDGNVKKEVVSQKRKASQSPQVTAAVSIAPLNSYHGESLQREASVPAKRKKSCCPRGLNSEVSDSLAVTGNTNAAVRSSLQFGNGYNTNASLASSLQAGNGYNMDATIASYNASLQVRNGYNTNATATASSLHAWNGYNTDAIVTASRLQAGNGYNTNASDLQSGNGYSTNVTIASSLQLGNCRPRGSNTEVSDSLAVNGNIKAPGATSLQVGNGYNANAAIVSNLQLENFNLFQTSEVGDIQRFEKIKEVIQRHELNNSKRKFDNHKSATVIFKLWNSSEIGKSKDATTGIADQRYDMTRTLTFMRQSHLHQGNEIPIVESKACVKLVMSKKKFTEGLVDATVFYEHEEGIGPTVIHIPLALRSMHFLDLFTAQFTSLMVREGHCLVSDQREPVLLNGDNCSVDCLVDDRIEPALLNDDKCSSTRNIAVTAGVPLVALALGMISSSTLELSTSMLSTPSDVVSAINICGRLPSNNLNSARHFVPPINIQSAQHNSGSHLLPPGNIQSAQQNFGQLPSKNLNSRSYLLSPGESQSAQQNPGNNLSKLQLDNAAAQMNPGQPHWQQILSNQAQLQFQMMQRQRQQDQLTQSMKVMGGLSASVGGSGTLNMGGRIQGGNRNSARGSFRNGMGTGGSAHNIAREGQIPSTSNVGQFSNIGGSNIPSSSDSKQQLFGCISDNAVALLAELRTADGGQGRSLSGGFQFWNNSGMVQMQTPNIQDMAYLLSNQQILPQKQRQQQEMRSVVQPQTKTSYLVNNVSLPPNRVSSQRFYQQPQISPLQLNSGPARMQQQINRNIVFGPGSPELSSRIHVPLGTSNTNSSKN